jgi:hypothetical protein
MFVYSIYSAFNRGIFKLSFARYRFLLNWFYTVTKLHIIVPSFDLCCQFYNTRAIMLNDARQMKFMPCGVFVKKKNVICYK